MNIKIDGDKITVDGAEYVRVNTSSREFALTAEHISAARNLVGGWDALLWAFESGATPREMEAWAKAMVAERLDPKRPLPTLNSKQNGPRGLFD